MDLDQLLQDIPKYKPWLSAVAWEAWEEFCATTEKLSISCLNPWALPKLVSDSIAATEVRKRHSSPSVSNNTHQILEKESTAVQLLTVPQILRAPSTLALLLCAVLLLAA